MRRLLAALLLLCCSEPALGQEQPPDEGSDTPSSAPSAESASALLDRAKAAFSNGDFRRSQQLLGQAKELTRRPALLAQIHLLLGLNAAARGEMAPAREAFQRALLHDPGLTLDARRHSPSVVRVFDSVRRKTLGTLHVTMDRPGARIWIDGRLVERGPYRGLLPIGPHQVEVKAPDGRSLSSRAVTVAAGRVVRIHVVDPTGSAPSRPASRPAKEADGDRTGRLWTWIAAGATAVSTGIALGLGISASEDADAACALLDGEGPCGSRSRLADPADVGRYEDLYDGANSKRRWAAGLGIAAGALGATAVLLYFLESSTSRERRDAGVSLQGLLVELRY